MHNLLQLKYFNSFCKAAYASDVVVTCSVFYSVIQCGQVQMFLTFYIRCNYFNDEFPLLNSKWCLL